MADRAFYESLPSKRMGAGCIFVNRAGDVLLVKPTYKPGWEIPGGVVEDDESPYACCQREVHEELGLQLAIGNLLVVDYNTYPDEPHKTEALMFIFDGGVLGDQTLARIQLPAEELSTWQCFPGDDLPPDLDAGLRRRVTAAVRQRGAGGGIYLENQTPNR